MVAKLDQLDTSIVHDNPYWTYRRDTYRLPDGSDGLYFYVDSLGSIMVLPRVGDGSSYAMVLQWRYLFDAPSLEFPAGGIAPGEDPRVTAGRETQEEAGLAFDDSDLIQLGTFAPCNGLTNERCFVFEATKTYDVPSAPEPSEEFEILALSPAEIDARIRSGEIFDGMTIAAWGLRTPT